MKLHPIVTRISLTIFTSTLLFSLQPTIASAIQPQTDSNLPTLDFADFNPSPNFTGDSSLPSQIVSKLMPLAITFAGLVLLIMILAGGFQMLTNPTNPDAQAGGKQRITWAVVGFFTLFATYWIMQIFEILFNINIV